MNSESSKNLRLSSPIKIADQAWPEGSLPEVSVFCITYNHVNFIRDAIEGFLMQKTTFPVEIFIHDDASTDGTSQIVKEYAKKYPLIINAEVKDENQWAKGKMNNYVLELMVNLKGKYIAHCEGDDYWTDSSKLQIQVEALESNNLASGCFHTSSLINGDGIEIEIRPRQPVPKAIKFEDVIISNPIFTCSLLFRSVLINKDRNWYADLPMGDWPLQVELTSHGPLIGIDKNMSVYRSHHGGVWTQKSMLEQLKLCSKFYYSVKKEYYSKITVSFYENLFNHHLNLFILSWENQKYIKSLTNIYSYLVLKGEIQYLSIKQLLCRKLSKKNCKV